MKDILVHVDESPAGAARVQSAVTLAKGFGARLTGLHVKPDVDISPGVPLAQVDTLVEVAERRLATGARRARTLFSTKVATAGLESAYRTETGGVARGIAEAARYADLVVVGQYEREGSLVHHPLPVCHSVSVRCGRPVLVLPRADKAIGALSRIVIAWDGSREAVRAVHDAIPFLTAAKSVAVIVAKPGREHLAPDVQRPRRLREHLARHGVTVTSWTRLEAGPSVAETIDRRLDGAAADLLVMGAYTHPEWYEFFAGGVTRSLLLTSPIPLLISH